MTGLDPISWRILELLQADARLSFAAIGREVGLTAPAVAERVRRLEEAGVIMGYHAHVDPSKLGYGLTAIVRINITTANFKKTAELLEKTPEVLEAYRTTGTDGWVAKIAAVDIAHLEQIINRFTVLGISYTSLVLSTPVERRVLREAQP